MKPSKIVLASGNKGKLAEFNQLFTAYDIEVVAQSAFKVSDVDETGTTFVENAIIKARHAAEISGLPALADDSGLCVSALRGAPGIYSARYAGIHGDNMANNQKLLHEMQGQSQRHAFFICVLVYLQHAQDPTPLICMAKWHGEISLALAGSGGFGYDPLFYLPDYQLTAAEIDKSLKNTISHRAQALQQLMQHF